MIEKFSDYEGTQYLNKEGVFDFEITEAELKESSKGTPMVVLTAKSDEGQTTLYHSLNPKARWSYNNLIKACFKLNTKEKIAKFELDYELIHNQLIGKKFAAQVIIDKYEKPIKIALEDGTFEDSVEIKDTYKVDTATYHEVGWRK